MSTDSETPHLAREIARGLHFTFPIRESINGWYLTQLPETPEQIAERKCLARVVEMIPEFSTQ